MIRETVTVTPKFGNNDKGEPIASGTPYTLTPLEIAPGNTAKIFKDNGSLETAEFTLYFDLGTLIDDDYEVVVRTKTCRARVLVWRSGRTGRGGIVVLCKSAAGSGR